VSAESFPETSLCKAGQFRPLVESHAAKD
jgi:hypothetical protein